MLPKTPISRSHGPYHANMATKRPRLVAFVACWLMLAGLLSPLFLLELGDESLADRLAHAPDMGAWHLIAGHFGPKGVALFGVAYMLMLGVIGYGLWNLREWARRAVMGLAIVSLIWTVWHIDHNFFNGGNIVVLLLVALVLYYLEWTAVKYSFA